MKRYLLNAWLAAAVLSSLVSCNSSTGEGETKETAQTVEADSIADVSTIDGEREPTDDELREFGVIKSVEDSGYPFYSVTIEFPERQMVHVFDLNVEAIHADIEMVNAMVGKYATIYYTIETEPNLAELQLNGVSLMYDQPLPYRSEWETITGILDGADEPTPGDLPGKITVKDKDGNAVSFEYYVDDGMVAANGKQVKAFYSQHGKSIITYMRASESVD